MAEDTNQPFTIEGIALTEDGTVGLIRVKSGIEKTKTIPGYFNKRLLKAAIDRYFDLFDEEGVQIHVKIDEEHHTGLLLFGFKDGTDIFVGVAGRTERDH